MANRYATDLQFGHKCTVEFCKRPFATVAEMNARIIGYFQSRVQADDDLRSMGPGLHDKTLKLMEC